MSKLKENDVVQVKCYIPDFDEENYWDKSENYVIGVVQGECVYDGILHIDVEKGGWRHDGLYKPEELTKIGVL